MKQITREWIRKAEGDRRVARREHAARPAVHDAVCFHCQQFAEKYLKGLLQEFGLSFAKTHDLVDLIDRLIPTDPVFGLLRPLAFNLTRYAVQYRYPGKRATSRQARSALIDAERVRAEIRRRLGLRPRP